MNKLFNKIAGLTLGLAMAIGVGAAIANRKGAIAAHAYASPYSVTLDNHASGNNNAHITTADQESFSYDGITWSHSATWGNNGSFIGTGKSVAQWGSKKKPAATVSFSTTGFANKIIQNITVNGYCTNSTGPTVSATAGGTSVFTDVAMVQTTATNYNAASDVAITLGASDTVVITLTNPNTDGVGEKGSGMNIVSISVKWASPITQTITSDIESPYTDEDVTLTTNAPSADWEITANTAGASISSASGQETVVSATQAGSVTIKATANGYTTVSKTLTFTDRPVGTYYDVTFDSDGGSESPAKLSVAENATFTFPSAGTKAHHSFLGWSSNGGTTKHAVGATSPAVTANISYKGYWQEDAKYDVSYVPGEHGTGASLDSKEYTGSYTLLSFANTGLVPDTGYRFKNYSVVIGEAAAVTKNPGDTITLNATTTITAIFELIPLEYTIAYTGSTSSNMDGTNQANDLFGLDEAKWSVIGIQNEPNYNVGLNKDGTIRLYAKNASGNGNTLEVASLDNAIVINEITITLGAYSTGLFEVKKVVGETATVVTESEGKYAINAPKFTIQNIQTGNTNQVQIESILVEYDYVASFKAALAFENSYVKRDISYPGSIPTGVDGTDCLPTSEGGKGYYDTAVEEYGKLSDDAKIWFASRSEFANARARMIAWAAANGETIEFNPSTGAIESARVQNNMIASSKNASVIIIIVSSISLVALLGAALMIKRRKEDR